MKKKILVYSSLFPSRFQPGSGLFVAELVRALAKDMLINVIKPVHMLRNIKNNFSEPRMQSLDGDIIVSVPLFFNVPGVLKATDGWLMALSTQKVFRRAAGDDTSLVHAHFAYPDAAAAQYLSRGLELPLVITVHGSDVHMHAKDPKRKGAIIRTLKSADAVVCVSVDLVKKVSQMGISGHRVHHIPNGVDIEKFRPADKAESRDMLGIGHMKRILLTVGNLVPVKAYDHLIRALPKMGDDVHIVLAGQGTDRKLLESIVAELGMEKRVHFVGAVGHDRLYKFYSAADFLVISSHSEGWPTVIYEAFACGLPILAHRIGGIPEAISSPALGLLMDDNDPNTIAKTVTKAYSYRWNKAKLVDEARRNSWREVAIQYNRIYEKVLLKKDPERKTI